MSITSPNPSSFSIVEYDVRYFEEFLHCMKAHINYHNILRPDYKADFVIGSEHDEALVYTIGLISDDACEIRLCIENEHVLGLAIFAILDKADDFHQQKALKLLKLFVHRDARGRGIGSALIAELSHIAKTQGADYIIVSCFANNESGNKFYQKAGFDLTNMIYCLPTKTNDQAR